MSGNDIILGIDTSNYTTSLAIMEMGGRLIANIKRPLTVKEGERGLRQSDAVFAHIKNIPSCMNEAGRILGGRQPIAVGVSSKPRNIDGSYMPCFLSGVACAESIAASLNIPIYSFSHQCGHIMAALYSCGNEGLIDRSFAAFHISGGTTELLRVSFLGEGFSSELVGGTHDLNAGQIIDRIGVYLGMPFPAGPHIESAALRYKGKVDGRKPSVDGMYANLSGLENMAVKLYRETADVERVSAFVLNYIGRAVLIMCNAYRDKYGDTPFLFAGGVMCNSIIRGMLSAELDAYFAEPSMSSDNAVGIAELTRRCVLKKGNE